MPPPPRLCYNGFVMNAHGLNSLAGVGTTRWWALGIAALHLVLGLLYSVVIPPWEGVDEWSHYKYAEYVALHRSLPDPSQRLTDEYEFDQATQPPLYYALTALAILPASPSDGFRIQVNPYAYRGEGLGGANFVVHDPAVERFPWRGSVLALHLARLVSVLISTLALWPTYSLTRFLFPQVPALALGAVAFQGFLPQYVYMGSIVHNDILVALVGGVVLYKAVRIASGSIRLSDAAVLAIASGLLIWSKVNGFALVPIAFLALLIGVARRVRRPGSRRLLLLISLGALGLLALLVGLWIIRNLASTGNIFPRFSDYPQVMLYWVYRQPHLASALHFDALPYAWTNLKITFWGIFGWENIPTFPWFYSLSNYLALAALVGLFLHFIRPRLKPARGGLFLLLLACVSVLLLAVFRVLFFEGGLSGRYLFPALAGFSVLFAVGVIRLLPGKMGGVALGGVGVAFALVSLISLYVHVRPAYALPRPLSPDAISSQAKMLNARFGDVAELIAYEVDLMDVRPGQTVRVTLYWRALSHSDHNYTLGVHILGPDLEDYGMMNTFPGQGNYATSIWQPGTIFREEVYVVARPNGPLPALGQLSVALFQSDLSQVHLPVVDREGQPLGGSVIFGRLRLSPHLDAPMPVPELALPLYVTFGQSGNIHLRSAEMTPSGWAAIDSTLVLTLTWESVEPLPAGGDVNVFVHLLDERGETMRQADAPPGGAILPTDLWRAGDWLTGEHRLSLADLSSGDYRLALGLYRLDGEERLAAFDANGARLADDRLLLEPFYLAGRAHQVHLPAVER